MNEISAAIGGYPHVAPWGISWPLAIVHLPVPVATLYAVMTGYLQIGSARTLSSTNDLQARETHFIHTRRQILVPDSSHMMPLERPDIVVSAVHEVWSAAKNTDFKR